MQDIATLVSAVRDLGVHVPKNEFGLPSGIFRPDLLPVNKRVADENVLTQVQGQAQNLIAGFTPSDLDNAFEPIYYDEGFPTQPSGLPFWEILNYEPARDFQYFSDYLKLGYPTTPTGGEGVPKSEAKAKAKSDNHNEVQNGGGVRSLHTLALVLQAEASATTTVTSVEKLLEELASKAVLFYWHQRARAYDLYRVVRYKQQQELRGLELNNNHHAVAARWFKNLEEYIGDKEEFWEMLTPKVAVDFLGRLVSMQRVAVGLPANGPPNAAQNDGGQSLEFHFKQVAAKESADLREMVVQTGADVQAGSSREAEDAQIIEKILSDANATQQMQEIVIRMTSGVVK